jgi:hypothetical protein
MAMTTIAFSSWRWPLLRLFRSLLALLVSLLLLASAVIEAGKRAQTRDQELDRLTQAPLSEESA